jgi:hypothetical protein
MVMLVILVFGKVKRDWGIQKKEEMACTEKTLTVLSLSLAILNDQVDGAGTEVGLTMVAGGLVPAMTLCSRTMQQFRRG